MTGALPLPFTKAEMLVILAKTAFAGDDTGPYGRAFAQQALQEVTEAMRRAPAIAAADVDAYMQLARSGGGKSAELLALVARLAAALPDADYTAAMAGVISQAEEWAKLAARVPAARVQ